MPLQEDDERLTVTFGLTIDDIVAFNAHHAAKSRFLKKQLRLVLLAIAIPFVLIFVVSLSTDDPLNTFWEVVRPLLIFACVFLFIVSRKKATMREATRGLLSESDNPNLLGRRVLTISPQGVYEQWPYGEHRHMWQGVVRIETAEEHGFIYVAANEAMVVPQRAFASAEEFDHFVSTARRLHESAPPPTAPPSDVPLARPVDDAS